MMLLLTTRFLPGGLAVGHVDVVCLAWKKLDLPLLSFSFQVMEVSASADVEIIDISTSALKVLLRQLIQLESTLRRRARSERFRGKGARSIPCRRRRGATCTA